MIKIAILSAVVLYCVPLRADCNVPPGTFEQRTRIASELDLAIQNQNQEVQQSLEAKLVEIDNTYQSASAEIFSPEKSDGRSECCLDNQTNDPVVRLLCTSKEFIAKQMTDDKFIELFPVTESGARALFLLDEIARTPNGGGFPQEFRDIGPTGWYIRQLYQLVEKDRLAALEKYVHLYQLADGIYAEQMEDEAEGLFLKHPSIVLEHWNLLHTHKRMVNDLREAFSDAQKRQFLKKLSKLCPPGNSACIELRKLFREK